MDEEEEEEGSCSDAGGSERGTQMRGARARSVQMQYGDEFKWQPQRQQDKTQRRENSERLARDCLRRRKSGSDPSSLSVRPFGEEKANQSVSCCSKPSLPSLIFTPNAKFPRRKRAT